SYAQIAANALPPKIQPLSGPSPPPDQVTAVLRPYEDSILKKNIATPAEITAQVKKTLQTGVVLAIPLQSGDIRVVFTTKIEKNKALTKVEELKEIKAYFKKEEFPIEVMSIPISLHVAHGKDADNRSLMEALEKVNN